MLKCISNKAKGTLSTHKLKAKNLLSIRFCNPILALCLMVYAFFPHEVYGQNEKRSLSLYNLKTGERSTILYKADGVFLSSGLKRINYFLRDWRENSETNIDPRVVDLLWEIYQETGSKKAIHILSGYRSKKTNNKLKRAGRKVARNSQHTHGKAIDFYIPGVPTKKLRNIALRKQYGGVGYYPRENSPFVHIDVGSVRHWPRMSDRTLKKVFPHGHSLHVPQSGKALPHYKKMVKSYGSHGLKPARNSLVVAKGRQEKRILASLSQKHNTVPSDIIMAYGKTDQTLTKAFDTIIRPKNLPVSRKVAYKNNSEHQPKQPLIASMPTIRKPTSPTIMAHAEVQHKAKHPSQPLLSEPKYLKSVNTQIVKTAKLINRDFQTLQRSKKDIDRGFAVSQKGFTTANTLLVSVALTKQYLLTLRAMKNG